MEIKVRCVCKGYVAYACPRCLNGTMKWEQDKADSPSYLKCILCGREVWKEKKFEKTGENTPKRQRFEPTAGRVGENKGVKKTYKWQFMARSGKLVETNEK